MHALLSYLSTGKKKHYKATCTTMSLSRQSTSKLKAPFIRTWLWQKKLSMHTAWGLRAAKKRTLYIYTKEKSVFQKKKNSKPNICTVLRDLTDNFCTETFPGGWTHTHTHIYISYWLDYCTIFHWQVELKKSLKKKNTTKNLQNTEENMQNTLWNVSMDWLHYRLFSWELVFVTFQYVRCEVWEHHMRKKNPYLSSRRTGLRNFCYSNIFWGFSSLALGVE